MKSWTLCHELLSSNDLRTGPILDQRPDQTETGPVRVRGAMSMAAQVERQSIYAEAEATRARVATHLRRLDGILEK